MMETVPVSAVRVFGHRHYVETARLPDRTKLILPMRTKDGRRWSDTVAGERAIRRGESSHIHRANIEGTPEWAEANAEVERILSEMT